MKKSLMNAGIIFIIFLVLTYLLLANSHIALFPGVSCLADYSTKELECTSGLVSLLAHNRGVDAYGYDQIQSFGWGILALVLVGIPGLISYGLFAWMKKSE